MDASDFDSIPAAHWRRRAKQAEEHAEQLEEYVRKLADVALYAQGLVAAVEALRQPEKEEVS